MPEYNENDIIKGCQDGDRVFQQHLYQAYYSTLMKVCVRYAKDMQDAEQLLNDGFIKIFTHIGRYERSGSFEGWMKRIVINTCLDYLKSSYVKNSMKMSFNPNLVENTSLSISNESIEKMEFKALVNMIQTLPPMTKTVFNLFVFEGFSHKEIAKQLDISEGTSYWHVHQGRTLMQQKIKKNNAENLQYERKRV
jgi:RNA polymerase sigma-70 factor (ECF subfamily)